MRNYVFLCALVAVVFSSCVTVKEVGHLNMLSTRNVELGSQKYVRVATYAGESKSELRKSKAKSIDDAINNTVRQYPGGEFMTNVKVWAIMKKRDIYFAVSGDIYGIANEDGVVDRSYRGFAVGDNVVWSEVAGVYLHGVIETLVDNETCLVKREDGKTVKVKYTKLSK